MNEQLLPEFSEEINLNKNQIINTNRNININVNTFDNNNNYFLKEKKSQELEENPQISINNFSKIIIPYNFKKNNYSIPDKALENYSGKDYVLNTLYDLNLKKIFKLDSPYSPSCIETLIVNVPMLLIFLIVIYFLFVIVNLFLFNPITIFFSYICLRKVFEMMSMIKKTLYEKYKKKAMKKILAAKNNSNYCKDNKVKWKLGLSAYWLELIKIQ